jgi:hypothetical protein
MITHGSIGRSWATNYHTAARLPLHPSLGPVNSDYPSAAPVPANLTHAALAFCHGGLSPTYPDLSPFPSKINNLGSSLLKKLQQRNPLPEPYPPAAERPGLANATEAETRFDLRFLPSIESLTYRV